MKSCHLTLCLSHAGFDSDNSSGEFSEANQRLTGVITLRTIKIGMLEQMLKKQENGFVIQCRIQMI